MKELYFIRHGQTEWNAIRRMQGQWNSDLSALGRDHAEVNGRFLKDMGIKYMVASPLDRTRQTADIINRYLQIGYDVDERLKEWHCGEWSGEMWADLPHKWPVEFAAWQADQFYYRGPGAENYPDMIARSTPLLDSILTSQFDKIAIVSHGMIGRAMVGTLLAMTPKAMLSFSQTNDTVFRLTLGSVAATNSSTFQTAHYIAGNGPFGGLPMRL
ncbi:MAG: histidine phosphatase family protein [Pseudomonadales bacterium]